MRQWLNQFLRLVASSLALSIAVLGHASAASAMPEMHGMDHGSTGAVCQVLCTSALGQRQVVPKDGDVDDDGSATPVVLSAAALAPFVPQRIVADEGFCSGPPSKVPLYLRYELLRV